jgi:hypothetical protein
MRFSYPILLLEGAANSTDVNKNGFIRDIVIDKIILKRKTGK